ncbi:MAG: hypothetical protein Fues2KO_08710 [Fuerstiella sp.]
MRRLLTIPLLNLAAMAAVLLFALALPVPAQAEDVSAPRDADDLPTDARLRLGSAKFRASGHSKTVRFVPHSDTFLVQSATGRPQLYDVHTGIRLREFAAGMHNAICDISPDGYIATLARNPEYRSGQRGHTVELRVQRGRSGRRYCWNTMVSDQPRHLAISPDRSLVLTISSHGQAVVRDCDSTEVLREQKLDFHGVRAAHWSPDGQTIAIAGRNGVLIWHPKDPESIPQVATGFTGGAECIRFSNDGRLLAVAEIYHPTVYLFEASTRKQIRSIEPSHSEAGRESICFSPDDRRLYIPNPAHHTIDEFDVQTGELTRRLRSSLGVTSVDVNSLGTRLVGIGVEQSIGVWNLPDGDELTVERPGHEVVPHLVVFSDDHRSLFSTDVSGRLNHWDCTTGELTKSLDVRTDDARSANVAAMDVSADNRLLAALCSDGSLRVWDIGAGEQIARHDGHGTSDVMKLRFLPGDREIVSGSADDGIKLTKINAEQRWLADLNQDLSEQDLAGAGVNLMRWSTGVRDDEHFVGPLIYQPNQLDQSFVLPFRRNFVDVRQTPRHTTTINRARRGKTNALQLDRFRSNDLSKPVVTEQLPAGQAQFNDDGSVCVVVAPVIHEHRRVAWEAVFYEHSTNQKTFDKSSITLPDSVRHSFLSPDGNLLATVLDDTTILLFDKANAE